jgi:hypothetical protein
VAKTAITLKGSRRGFAGAGLGMKSLGGYFDLQRQVTGPQIRRSSPYTKRLFVHHFRVAGFERSRRAPAGGGASLRALAPGGIDTSGCNGTHPEGNRNVPTTI